MPAPDHGPQRHVAVSCAVVTVSDTRSEKTDSGGALVRSRLQSAGHSVVAYDIIPDEIERIRTHVDGLCARPCDAIVITGGTGIAPRDVTYEAIAPRIEKRLDGFAELFRMLSFEAVGPAAMLSRALAGTCRKTLIFSIPGSPQAVELAMDRLILPVLTHAAGLLRT